MKTATSVYVESMKTRKKIKSTSVAKVEPPTPTYRVYPIRWLQLIIYVFVTFSNGIFPSTFSPIEPQTITFFSITATQVNILAVLPLFLYVPGTFLSTWTFQRFTMRTVIIIGSVMNLGGWIRVFSLISPSNGYAALVIGQILPALSAPLFFNAATLFSTRWFAPGERDLATAICSMANPLGIAIGFLFPSLIITDGGSSQQFLIVLTVEAGLATLSLLIVIIGFRSDPATPSSASNEEETREFKRDFLSLITNRHYLILLFSFSLGFAFFNALIFILYEIVQPCSYSSSDSGIFGAISIAAGIVGAGLTGVIMDRTRSYILLLKILIIGACCSIIYFIVILRPSMFFPLAVSFGLMGFFLLPLLPVVFECAVQCTYPICAAWSIGILLCVGNLLGGGFTFILAGLAKLAPTYTSGVVFTPVAIFIFCIAVSCTIVLLFYNGPYLRLKAETEYIVKVSSPGR